MPVRCTWNPTRIGSSLPAAHAVRATAPSAIDPVPAIAAAPAVGRGRLEQVAARDLACFGAVVPDRFGGAGIIVHVASS